MAYPHPGVVQAAQDPSNGIMQPNELSGIDIYSIRASVPSPFINVLCATGINESSLAPLVYAKWANASLPVNMRTLPNQVDTPDPYLGGTEFDSLFEGGPDYGLSKWPPVFPKLPAEYNTIANDTTGCDYGRNAVYVLGKGGDLVTNNFALCELRVGQTPACSTQYNASSNVATLEVICEDPNDQMSFLSSSPIAVSGNASYSNEWPKIASMWIRSINMDSGAVEPNSSNARLWPELLFAEPQYDWTGELVLDKNLPSPAEALAVMSGCTLLQSAQDAPFVEFWNYSGFGNMLELPTRQWFTASVHQQQYASGGTAGYEQAFNVVLFAVFFINVRILVYWLWHRVWYIDFSDPRILLGLAMNSHPNRQLAESSLRNSPCEGPRYDQFWKVQENADGLVHMVSPSLESKCGQRSLISSWKPRTPKVFSQLVQTVTSPVSIVKEKFGSFSRLKG
ncbi:uncharacterized protein LTR77_005869 [Saxophila tyrrhenica]|uniref:Uncharacterized protein n=1 Tax=Saxophila tyrrhenica TaxID=1690608 RepID=A0AAV9P9M3_9PEZI|nr:hypothetical protein LTR77_005869 [Saxophila tyrrhenica]